MGLLDYIYRDYSPRYEEATDNYMLRNPMQLWGAGGNMGPILNTPLVRPNPMIGVQNIPKRSNTPKIPFSPLTFTPPNSPLPQGYANPNDVMSQDTSLSAEAAKEVGGGMSNPASNPAISKDGWGDFFGNPVNMGLLGAASSLLESSGPSPTPVSLGQVIGRAGTAGISGFMQGQNMQVMNMLRQAQLAKALKDDKSDTIKTLEAAGIPREQWAQIVTAKMTRPQNQLDVKVNSYAPASEEAQKDLMKETRENYSRLRDAPAVLDNIEKAKALIPQAKGFMGTGGETLLDATKFLNNRLGMSISTEGVKSAEELRSRVFFQIMENLKKMDAQPSQLQQQIMMDALGKLGTDPSALGNVLDAYGDIVKTKIDIHNKTVEDAVRHNVKFPYDPRITLPERKPPQAGNSMPGIRRYNPQTGRIE